MPIETLNNMSGETADSGDGPSSGQGGPDNRTTPDTSLNQASQPGGLSARFRKINTGIGPANPTVPPVPTPIDLSAQQGTPDTQGINGPTSSPDTSPGNGQTQGTNNIDDDTNKNGTPSPGPGGGGSNVPPGGGNSPPAGGPPNSNGGIDSVYGFGMASNDEARRRARDQDEKDREDRERKRMNEKIRIWVNGNFQNDKERQDYEYAEIINRRRRPGTEFTEPTIKNRINETAKGFVAHNVEQGQDPEQARRAIIGIIEWLYQETEVRSFGEESFSMWIPVSEKSVRHYLSFVQEIPTTPDNPLANYSARTLNEVLIDLGLEKWEVMDSRSEAGYPQKMLKPRDPDFIIPLIVSQLQALEAGLKFSTEDRFKNYMNLAFVRVLSAMDSTQYEKMYDELIARYPDSDPKKKKEMLLRYKKENVEMAQRISALKTVRGVMNEKLGLTESTVQMKDIAAALKSISFLYLEDYFQMPGMDVFLNVIYGIGRRNVGDNYDASMEYPVSEVYPITEDTPADSPILKMKTEALMRARDDDGEPNGEPVAPYQGIFRYFTREEMATKLLEIAEGIAKWKEENGGKRHPLYTEYQMKMILAFKKAYTDEKSPYRGNSNILEGSENCARRLARAVGGLVETHQIREATEVARNENGEDIYENGRPKIIPRLTEHGESVYEFYTSNKGAEYAFARLLLAPLHYGIRQNVSSAVNMERGFPQELFGKWDIFQKYGSFITALIKDGIEAQGPEFVIKYQDCVKIIRTPTQEGQLEKARREYEDIQDITKGWIRWRKWIEKDSRDKGYRIPADLDIQFREHMKTYFLREEAYANAIRPPTVKNLISKDNSPGIVYESFDFTKINLNEFSYWKWAKGTALFDWADLIEKADAFRNEFISKYLKYPNKTTLVKVILESDLLDYLRADKPAAVEDFLRAYVYYKVLDELEYSGSGTLENAKQEIDSLEHERHISPILKERLSKFAGWVEKHQNELSNTREGYLWALTLFDKQGEGELLKVKNERRHQVRERLQRRNSRIPERVRRATRRS